MKDAYGILGEERMKLADKLAKEMRGKTTSESLDVILKYMPAITAGRKFTDEERKIVIDKIRENMNDTEKMKLDEILSILGMI
ncbi:MAG: hypothetical protein E7235_04135 [Lachnospiraceae bacterium]|nr:hypothetical protein [Lachnospiraceae bacterium]